MKKMWMLSLILLLVACSTTNETDANVQGENGVGKEQAMTVFEPGTYKAERLTLALPEDKRLQIEQIALTMQLALVEHQEWYNDELSKLEDGEPLPYDERLGVSEEEYKLLIVEDTDLVLTKVGETNVTVTQAKKQLKIHFEKQTMIQDMAITNNGESLVTEIGELTYVGKVAASEDQQIGRWNGHHYRLGEEDNTKTLHISLGKLEESGQQIVRVEVMSEGDEKLEEFIVF